MNSLMLHIKKYVIIIIEKLIAIFMSGLRKLYNKIRKMQLKNQNVSIIANNCIAGIIYHDFNMKFLSPTINLYFETHDDYLEFLNNIPVYSSITPIQIYRNGIKYPVGKLQNGEKSVVIHFMHYKTFEEAVNKWLDRGKRINYDNIVIIWDVADENGPDKLHFEEFDKLEYSKKMIITGKKCDIDCEYIDKLSVYSENYFPGKILTYKSATSLTRYFDDSKYLKLLK